MWSDIVKGFAFGLGFIGAIILVRRLLPPEYSYQEGLVRVA